MYWAAHKPLDAPVNKTGLKLHCGHMPLSSAGFPLLPKMLYNTSLTVLFSYSLLSQSLSLFIEIKYTSHGLWYTQQAQQQSQCQ